MGPGFTVNTCAILADPRPNEKRIAIGKAIECLEARCAKLGIETETHRSKDPGSIVPAAGTDAFVVVGGDGTMIHYAGPLAHHRIPFYGLNFGNVGFMMNQVLPDMVENVRRLKQGEFGTWDFPLLEVDATDLDGEPHAGLGLNDIYLQRMTAQTCRLNVSINDEPLAFNPILCDGVIISTPLGSTAYGFNVTGAVVSIDCPALTLTPIAANRTCPIKSLTLPLDARVQVEVVEPNKRKVLVVSDSQNHGNITNAEIKSSNKSVRLCFTSDAANLPLRFINKCQI